jgi:osmotically inducible protein OsmC
MPALYSTKARAVGGREGRAESDDGLLKVDLAIPKELGGKGGATNPEQLFAAGYAACFESGLRHVARTRKLPLQDAAVTATVELVQEAGGGFALDVSLLAEIKGLDQQAAEELVGRGAQGLPLFQRDQRQHRRQIVRKGTVTAFR